MSTARGVKAGLRALAIALQIGSGDPLNAVLGVLSAGEAAAEALTARDRPLARHVADAAKRLRRASQEHDLPEGDRRFVELSLERALASHDPVRHLTLVLRGGDVFLRAVCADVEAALPAADRLSDAQSAYLIQLCSFVQLTLTGLLEDPARLPEPLIAALREHGQRIADHTVRLDAHDRVLSALVGRLDGAPIPRIVGSRPRLIEPRVELAEVEQLVAALTAGTTEPLVVSGMRGVGKSQLAAAVAERLEADSWDLVAWVSARTRDGLVADLARLASAYGIRDADESAAAAAVVDRLSRPDGERRLLVLDNVERFDDLAGLVPRSSTRVIATTTRPHSPWGVAVPLEPFTAPVAADYLDLTAPGTDPDIAADIAAELGHLPLALTQASATMTRLGLSGTTYLQALKRQPITTTLRRFDGDEYPASVEAALVLSIESATTAEVPIGPLVERMLTTAAFLSEDGFSAPSLLAIDADPLATGAARAVLVEHGILRSGEYEERLSLHRLFARVIGDRIGRLDAPVVVRDIAAAITAGRGAAGGSDASERDRVADTAVQLASVARMSAVLPAVAESPRLHRLVLACAAEAADARLMTAATALMAWQPFIAAAPSSTIEDTLVLSTSVARLHAQTGDADRAASMYEEAIAEASDSALAPALIAELNIALASALRHSGRVADSIELSRRTIAELTVLAGHVEGEDLSAVRVALGSAKNNLAGALRVSDATEEAIVLYDELLADEEAVAPELRGKIRNNRLQALKDGGALDEAISGYETLLPELRDAVGEEHPDWVVAHGNLAAAVAGSGDHDRGIGMLVESVERHERVLGRDDRLSLEVRLQLARVLSDAGREPDAREHLRIVHRRAREEIGAESAVAVVSGFALLRALIRTEEWPDAARVGTAVLRDRRDETLDPTDTALLRIYLGYAHLGLGNPRRALPLLERGAREYAGTPSPDATMLANVRHALSELQRDPTASGVVVVQPSSTAGARTDVGGRDGGAAFRRTTS